MKTPSTDAAGFGSLGLSPALVAAVAALGYEEPTPIQREAIPVLLSGSDMLGQAATGTGKTAAFALPLLDMLSRDSKSGRGKVRALVLVPTRELAMQVAEALHKYAKGSNLNVVPVYGGAPMDHQIRALRRGTEVVVGTPGRVLDHIRRRTLDLSLVQMLVLDEADEMLDMGFAEDIDAIVAETPATRQTALFAATFASRIMSIAGRHLRDPKKVQIAQEKRAPGKLPRIRQVAFIVGKGQKINALSRILDFESPKSAIVFCRTRLEVDELTDTLNAHGYGAQALHGGMVQKQRDRVMQLFRSEKADILVATDVAARGLDIDHVSHVVNFDLPTAAEVYVHRIGRTGRIGREGVAITLVAPREQRFLQYVERLTKQKIEIGKLPTEADLRKRRLESAKETLRARIAAGGLDDMRELVESHGAGVRHHRRRRGGGRDRQRRRGEGRAGRGSLNRRADCRTIIRPSDAAAHQRRQGRKHPARRSGGRDRRRGRSPVARDRRDQDSRRLLAGRGARKNWRSGSSRRCAAPRSAATGSRCRRSRRAE